MKAIETGKDIPEHLAKELIDFRNSEYRIFLYSSKRINDILNSANIKITYQELESAYGCVTKDEDTGNYIIILHPMLIEGDKYPEDILVGTLWHELYHIVRHDYLTLEKYWGVNLKELPEDEQIEIEAKQLAAECMVRWRLGDLSRMHSIALGGTEDDGYGWLSLRESMPQDWIQWKTSPIPPPEGILIEILKEMLKKNKDLCDAASQKIQEVLDNMSKSGNGSPKNAPPNPGKNDFTEVARQLDIESTLEELGKEIEKVFGKPDPKKDLPTYRGLKPFINLKGDSKMGRGFDPGNGSLGEFELTSLREYCQHIFNFLNTKCKRIKSRKGLRGKSWIATSKAEKMNDLPTNVYIPGKKTNKVCHIGFCVDTSGSMPDSMLLEAFKLVEQYAIKNRWQIRLVCGDTRVTYNDLVSPGNRGKVLAAIHAELGRGGTDLNDVYDTCMSDPHVRALVFITDWGTDRPKHTSKNALFVFNGEVPAWANKDNHISVEAHPY